MEDPSLLLYCVHFGREHSLCFPLDEDNVSAKGNPHLVHGVLHINPNIPLELSS